MEYQKKTLMMALSRTHKEWSAHMRKCALEVGIPDSYRAIIMYLSRHPGANQKALAEFTNTTTASINQNVRKMLDNGYLRKETDESDQRFTKLFLTEKGLEKSRMLRKRLSESDRIITEKIGAEKEEEIISLLGYLCEVIGEEL
ncbi:MAG: winged helix-turn-helix transcriptional regulator [Ruminiclostridium sp.]|nr:winged helix-turn-helix transcriptional regulator [Ruminiclostridium sp.]